MLEQLNISDETKIRMNQQYSNEDLFTYSVNNELINANIELLKSINIENIDEIFFRTPDVFLRKSSDIRNAVVEYGIDSAIEMINDDYYFLETIL